MALLKQLALLIALASAAQAQADRFGVPGCSGTAQEFADRTYFQLCYDGSHKVAAWVGYELTPPHLDGRVPRPTHFRADNDLAQASPQNADYRNSGFSRGHLAPSRDFAWSDQAIHATFLLSNAAPQLQTLNAGVWARAEKFVRQIAAESNAVYVFTGPIFAAKPSTIGAGQVAVPSHFFKVVLAVHGSEKAMYAMIVPNLPLTGQPLSAFLTTVDAVEAMTGLDFFAALGDEEEARLESGSAPDPNPCTQTLSTIPQQTSYTM